MKRLAGKPGLKDRFFPIIARIIDNLHRETRGFITRDKILGQLLNDKESRKWLGKEALEVKGGNLIDWFSAHFTMHKNGDTRFPRWGPIFDRFERTEIHGEVAYKPITLNAIGMFPDEVDEEVEFREGSTRKVLVNAFERDDRARRKCIEIYGTNCFVCNFSFGATYGKVVEGFIHVHHLRELSEIREEYLVDPAKDMRPVCPNCHAVLHRRKPAYSIKEVRSLLGST